MPDPNVDALIDRVVRRGRFPLARRREELRRELAAPCEDAAPSGDALRRFGDPDTLARSWRAIYRRERTLLYAAKLAVWAAVSCAAAMGIALASAPPAAFSYRAVPSAVVVLGLVVIREATRPFAATRVIAPLRAYAVTTGAARLLQIFLALVVVEYGLHAGRGLAFGITRGVSAAAALALVWAATLAIGARLDRLFADVGTFR
jgi:hypothetical protein